MNLLTSIRPKIRVHWSSSLDKDMQWIRRMGIHNSTLETMPFYLIPCGEFQLLVLKDKIGYLR
jgi:hypothetical protein